MEQSLTWLLVVGSMFAGPSASLIAEDQVQASANRAPIRSYLSLFDRDVNVRGAALNSIRNQFNRGDTGLLIEAATFARNTGTRGAIVGLLEQKTGQQFGHDFDAWYRWIWNQDVTLHLEYSTFKRELYRRIDPRFAEYFSPEDPATIRLDEIRWGGVRRDGIPPLKDPETIPADRVTYLSDTDVVFGVSFGGQSRAYPKRILAWHEMVKDTLGGLSINGVYCTLCGSMIVYETHVDGKHYELGTSGFLYRSNKLMYDHETKSMWSTLKGRPVVGRLVGKDIRLKPRYVVTTTWGHWKADHPDTDVLSPNTGHRRDYSEGAAYRDYFATDDLMFTVPKIDRRLKNKDEVLIVRAGGQPLAISVDFLSKHRVYHDQNGDVSFVVITDAAGASRVYEAEKVVFDRPVDADTVLSQDGRTWSITEEALLLDGRSQKLQRLPAHRAFWFGWFADHPGVRLVN